MRKKRDINREILGVALALIGLLFLLVNNGLLWFGWEAIWPIFFILAGAFFLRVYFGQRTPTPLFFGIFLLSMGTFFMLFSSGLLFWESMGELWPWLLLITGISLLAVSAVSSRATTPLTVGLAMVIFAVVSFFYVADKIPNRVSAPLVRLWPLMLIAAGILVFTRARRESRESQQSHPSGPEPGDPVARGRSDPDEILRDVRTAPNPDQAIRRFVAALKAANPKYSWVGVYRVEGDRLTLGRNHYAGDAPEHTTIRIPEGICGLAADRRETVIVPDVRKSDRYLACSPFTRSEIVVPIIRGGTLLGVLDIDSNEPDAFGDGDKNFLEAVVGKAASAF